MKRKTFMKKFYKNWDLKTSSRSFCVFQSSQSLIFIQSGSKPYLEKWKQINFFLAYKFLSTKKFLSTEDRGKLNLTLQQNANCKTVSFINCRFISYYPKEFQDFFTGYFF